MDNLKSDEDLKQDTAAALTPTSTPAQEMVGLILIEIYRGGGVMVRTNPLAGVERDLNPVLMFMGALETAKDVLLDGARVTKVYPVPK